MNLFSWELFCCPNKFLDLFSRCIRVYNITLSENTLFCSIICFGILGNWSIFQRFFFKFCFCWDVVLFSLNERFPVEYSKTIEVFSFRLKLKYPADKSPISSEYQLTYYIYEIQKNPQSPFNIYTIVLANRFYMFDNRSKVLLLYTNDIIWMFCYYEFGSENN